MLSMVGLLPVLQFPVHAAGIHPPTLGFIHQRWDSPARRWDSPANAWIHLRDAGIHPPDTGIHPPDTGIHPPDAGIHPSDAEIHPSDAGIHPPDAGIHPADTGIHLPDAGSDIATYISCWRATVLLSLIVPITLSCRLWGLSALQWHFVSVSVL